MSGLDKGALDRWLTREPEPDDDHDELECPHCEARLPRQAERATVKLELLLCEGPVTVDREYSDDELRICGEHLRGQTYPVKLDAPCGNDEEHEPHEIEMYSERTEFRTCPKCSIGSVRVLV